MYSSQLDFFPDGASADADKAFGHEVVSLLRSSHLQVWVENGTTPTFTFTLYGKLRKERVTETAYEPPWVVLATITNATAAADRLIAIPKRADKLRGVVSGYSGSGRVFAVVSGENIGGQR